MLNATHLLKQVVSQHSLNGAACLVKGIGPGPAILSANTLAQRSWPYNVLQQLSTSSKDNDNSSKDPQAADPQQHDSSSSSSSSSADPQANSSETSTSSDSSSSNSSDGGFSFKFSSFQWGSDSAGGDQQQQQEPLPQRAQKLWRTIQQEVADAVLPRQEGYSLTKKYEGPTYQVNPEELSGATALATVKQPESRFEQALSDLYSRFGHHPIFAKLRGVKLSDNPLYKKGAEIAEDIRDKYETSDHPAVHKVEDVKEKLFGMSETATAMAKIRARDPRFDMSTLLKGVRFDAPAVVKAFLTHDLATLQQHMGSELLEKLGGIFRHYEAQGAFEDPTILFTGEPELVELKLIEDEPLVVVQFACQQIKCTRDKFGNVIEGDPNSIQRVFYFWGLQQEEHGTVLPDGRVLPPRWVIKDMMWQSMLSLI